MEFLEKSDYTRILPLLNRDMPHYVHVGAAVSGLINARIAVDDGVHPRAALVMPDDGFCYLIGKNIPHTFAQACNRYFFVDNKTQLLELITPQENMATVEVLFGGHEWFRAGRHTYRLSHEHWLTVASPDSNGLTVSADITRGRLIVTLRNGTTEIGRCSALLFDGCAETDICIDPDHRKKGLGFFLAYHYIGYCLQQHLTPVWNCWEDNDASNRLAKRLGFLYEKRWGVCIYDAEA